MRDAEGTYIGVPDCINYRGMSHTVMQKCCGGKSERKVGFIKCALKDVVDAEISCTMYACNKYDGKQGKRS